MYTNINHTKSYYRDEGNGEPVLLIHGNPDSADMWEDIITNLNSDHRCIAPDLPGFGRSDIDLDVDFNLDWAGQWLASFIDSIDIGEPVHLILHDIGAFYGIPFAILHPEKVKTICISNTLFFSDYRWHFWGRVWRSPILGELTDYLISKWLYKINMRSSSPKLSDEHLDKSYKMLRSNPKTTATILKVYRAMTPNVFTTWEDRYIALTKQKPVMVFWGNKDNYIPMKFGYAERFAQGQKLQHLADAGHWAMIEEPQRFVNAWREFV